MARAPYAPALIVHGGAGAYGPGSDLPARRRGMLAAVESGAEILRCGGNALEAVVAAVKVLEDDPLFNAGYGSTLNADGKVEMDAGVMAARPGGSAESRRRAAPPQPLRFCSGAVAAVSRVRNPILLARAVMELTPHVLMVGAGAERLSRRAGIRLCRAQELVSRRALERWRARMAQGGGRGAPRAARLGHGTVGAAAVDSRGVLAAATSTGGYPRKLAGRVGDSAILGAGFFVAETGAASATGLGEAIIKVALCREAVSALEWVTPSVAAARAIAGISRIPGAEGGIVLVDRKSRVGFAHNAQRMAVAIFDLQSGVRYLHSRN